MFEQVAKENFSKSELMQERQDEFAKAVTLIKGGDIKFAKRIIIDNGRLCPWLKFIVIDSLDEKDHPHGIADNSVYLSFKVDIIEKKVEIFQSGHVYISKADKELYPRDKYLACHSMLNISKRNGVKPMRKSSYKNEKDLANKVKKAFEAIMEQVNDYTNGYPYKEGIKALKTA